MEAYKVVRGTDKLLSAFGISETNGRVLEYATERTTTPIQGNGPLAAFDNIYSAIYFCKNTSGLSIYICDVELWEEEFAGGVKTLWYIDKNSDMKVDMRQVHIPVGTIFCKSIRLIEEVNLEVPI